MSRPGLRFFRSVYRREPVSSFLILAGAMNIVIGGFGESGSLTVFGMGTVGAALAIRWWQLSRREEEATEDAPQLFLPPQPSQSQLPTLMSQKKRRNRSR